MAIVLDREPITVTPQGDNTRGNEIIACTLIFNPNIPRNTIIVPEMSRNEYWLAGESWEEIRVAGTDALPRVNAASKFSRVLRPWRDAIEKIILSRIVPLGTNAKEEVDKYLHFPNSLSTLEPDDCDWWIKYYGGSGTLATLKQIDCLPNFSSHIAKLEVHRKGPVEPGVLRIMNKYLGQNCPIFNAWTQRVLDQGLDFRRIKKSSTTVLLEMAGS